MGKMGKIVQVNKKGTTVDLEIHPSHDILLTENKVMIEVVDMIGNGQDRIGLVAVLAIVVITAEVHLETDIEKRKNITEEKNMPKKDMKSIENMTMKDKEVLHHIEIIEVLAKVVVIAVMI